MTRFFIGTVLESNSCQRTMAGWREVLEGLDEDHRIMLEGGSLSQLFLRYPLTICHPIFVGMVYGILASMTLIAPFAYAGWEDSTSLQDMVIDWGTISLMFCAMTATLGGFSLLISSLFKRPPVRLENRRRYLFPVPFIGLLLLTWAMIGDAPEFASSIGWFLAILPGPLYIHLSYAPRWRMLDRIDRGLDPFDGMKITIAPDNSLEPEELDDDDLDEVVSEA
jgi:hypothetical protein|tara:strand:- start:11646 stop:12314 length:669 start_codon:yes stop_codon:yes gene_type:complete